MKLVTIINSVQLKREKKNLDRPETRLRLNPPLRSSSMVLVLVFDASKRVIVVVSEVRCSTRVGAWQPGFSVGVVVVLVFVTYT